MPAPPAACRTAGGRPWAAFGRAFSPAPPGTCRTRISTRAWPLSRLSAWGPSFSRGYSPWVCSKYPWSTSAPRHVPQGAFLYALQAAVAGQLVKALAQHLLAFAAPGHLHHQGDAVPLPQVPHAGDKPPALLRHVHLGEVPHAVLAVGALGGGVLPKVVEDVLPQAAGGVAIAYHGLEPGLVLLVELLQGLLLDVLPPRRCG